MQGGAWWAAVLRVAKSQIWLSNWAHSNYANNANKTRYANYTSTSNTNLKIKKNEKYNKEQLKE